MHKDIYNSFILDMVAYLMDQEGWAEAYANNVVTEQISRVGMEMGKSSGNTSEDKGAAMQFFALNARYDDYISLINRIIDLLSKYKEKRKALEMGRKMKMMLMKYRD